MTTYTVTFERIGRNRAEVPDLTVEAANHNDLADLIYEHVAPKVMSSDVGVVLDMNPPAGGEVVVGFGRPAGSFTVTEHQGADA